MEQEGEIRNISITWRGKKFVLEMRLNATLEELGKELQKLAGVKADTMRLIVQSNRNSKLLSPFLDEHSHLALQETSVFEGKSIRMMGVPKDEVDQVLQSAKTDFRIAGFDEEEKRLRQRMSNGPHTSVKLPEGNYIFCEFRTLNLPGVELNPPPSEALRLMHRLAADPGIVAVMNKHRWRVGIMTEMAPEGKVGVSPVCILGLNKNQGEEISLRLRTDDLKGFRKYDVIKKTLLHELAHMVFSEHDAHFYALDSQLNKEATSLDWTKSRSHTLSGTKQSQHYDEEYYVGSTSSSSHKLGGNSSLEQLANARASSVAAAYERLANASINLSGESKAYEQPATSNYGPSVNKETFRMDTIEEYNSEPDPDDREGMQNKFEPDPDDAMDTEATERESFGESNGSGISSEPDPDDSVMTLPAALIESTLPAALIESTLPAALIESNFIGTEAYQEPDPDDVEALSKNQVEPDPDDMEALRKNQVEPDPDDMEALRKNQAEPDPDDMEIPRRNPVKLHPDDSMFLDQEMLRPQSDEPDPDDQELQRIQDPVTVVCSRLQKAIEMLQSEVNPSEAVRVLQTLFKIIKNVIEHPDEMKFRKLRKANPVIQRNIASYKAAMEFLNLIGFAEDVILEELGKSETYLVLKRNDPGLLWLAKSSLETCIAF